MSNQQSKLKDASRAVFSKVPEITLFFWITKLLTTGMGEVASDYLFEKLNPIFSVPVSLIIFIAAMIMQFKVRKYVAGIYWLVVIMVSIFGTTAADAVRVGLGIPYVASTIFFVAALAAILITWYVKEKTLSVHSIYTRRREVFYWLTVVTTFALGTAAGDMTANSMNLGYLPSGIMFSVILVLPAIGYWFFGLKEIAAFWFAYIMTRPVGASFADWLSAAHSSGGLGYSKGIVTFVLTVFIVILVIIKGGKPAESSDLETPLAS
ncbi:COG4705 family protein [Paenibacillus albus]|uniref:Membrane-anchored protein n=1 Tax=Paenibacillus albus TaxID=2495582 RepID=A0A3Q8X7H7_9BACL|nr:hypothetical protein [Paenibacillus albus]AZN41101.1 hypothetical protein EJC50_16560 [Paenibacillus albus]